MAAARARHVPAVPEMAAAFDFAEDGETFTGLGLPPVDKYTQRAEASGALCRLGATHPEMSQGELCKKVQHQVGLGRVGPVTTVFKALVAGYAAQGNKFVYDASKKNITPGKTPDRGKRMEIYSDGNTKPKMFYDSSHNLYKSDSKAHYGIASIFAGGPIEAESRKQEDILFILRRINRCSYAEKRYRGADGKSGNH